MLNKVLRKQKYLKILFIIGVLLLIGIFHSSKELDDHENHLVIEKKIVRHKTPTKKKKGTAKPCIWCNDYENDVLLRNELSFDHGLQMSAFWAQVRSMSSADHLYPTYISAHSFTPSVPFILNLLKSAKIHKSYLYSQADAKNVNKELSDFMPKDFGSTHKWLLKLEGGQFAIFKPLWYPTDYIRDDWFDGFELANAEIASFQVDRLLHFNKVPFTTGRFIHIDHEIMKTASPALKKKFKQKENEWCLTDSCYMCTEQETVCTRNGSLPGAVIYFVPDVGKPRSHPWDIKHYHKELTYGEYNVTRCHQLIKQNHIGPIEMLDLTDLSILDHLTLNFDSKVYKAKISAFANLMVYLDRGRSTYKKTDTANLLILKQCCRIRESTLRTLYHLQREGLSRALNASVQADPLVPVGVLNKMHYWAMDKRLDRVIDIISNCQRNSNS